MPCFGSAKIIFSINLAYAFKGTSRRRTHTLQSKAIHTEPEASTADTRFETSSLPSLLACYPQLAKQSDVLTPWLYEYECKARAISADRGTPGLSLSICRRVVEVSQARCGMPEMHKCQPSCLLLNVCTDGFAAVWI